MAAAGAVGGDRQVSEAYSAKWVRQMPDGPWSVVQRYYYVVMDDGLRLVETSEYLACSNPDDPGGTELASSAAYAEVASIPPLDDRAVQDAAREAWAPTNAEWNNQMPDWQVPW